MTDRIALVGAAIRLPIDAFQYRDFLPIHAFDKDIPIDGDGVALVGKNEISRARRLAGNREHLAADDRDVSHGRIAKDVVRYRRF